MTRGKIKLEYIANDAERRASFKKRKKGIVNKMNELCTLCDIQACIIIYSAYEPQPTVWPSPLDAQQIISRFRELPEMEQSQRLFNQESYTIQRIQKSHQQVEKLQRINTLMDMEIQMHQCMAGMSSLQNGPLSYITEMGRLTEQKMRDIVARMDELEKNVATNSQMGGMLNFPATVGPSTSIPPLGSTNAGTSSTPAQGNMPYGFSTPPGNTDAGTGSSPPGNDAPGPSFRN